MNVIANAEELFSPKRYFINNLDSYHSKYFLKAVQRAIEVQESKEIPVTFDLGEDSETLPPVQQYEIIGTVSDSSIEEIDDVTRIVPKDASMPDMLTCGTVLFDLSCTTSTEDDVRLILDYLKLLKDLLEKQVAIAAREADKGRGDVEREKRYIILVSTVMTWASTKPLDPDTPDLPFVETDFRKRKCHPKYKLFVDAENAVINLVRKYRKFIRTIVVCTGMTFGGKEDAMYYWFQKSWECEQYLPIIGRGNNVIPAINIADLAKIMFNLMMDFPKKLYILAIDQNVNRQRELIRALGCIAGSGMFKCIPPEDAFLIPEITQRIFDLMTLDLLMEPTYILESMDVEWESENAFPENVPVLMKEFKKERGLKPFKVIIYGPPLVGKTTLAKRICETYGLVYISLETIVEDLLKETKWKLAHWERGETADLGLPQAEDGGADGDDDDDGGEFEALLEDARAVLDLLQSGKDFTDEELLGFVRRKLLSKEAQNRGFVLDGIPANSDQCVLFDKAGEVDEVTEEAKEDEFEEDTNLYENVLKKLLPDIVVYLQASDDFVCSKAIAQPEGDPRFDEPMVLRRLAEFRTNDARDVTPMNFFDEISLHPLVVPVENHRDYQMDMPYFEVTLRMGRPCQYPKIFEMIRAADKKAGTDMDRKRLEDEKLKRELEEKMRIDKQEKMEYWSELYSLMREEEEQALAAASEPMRYYLIHHIFPTLTPALLEIAKLRPEDPIDFLAEYLFKMNPSGKMLEPGYNLQAEMLLGKIKILDDALRDLDIKIDPLVPAEADIPSSQKP